MLIADCLIVAGALGAGVAIMRNHRVDQLAAARGALAAAEADRELAHQDAVDAQRVTTLLAVENMRLQGDVRDLWAEGDAGHLLRADLLAELEGEQEKHHAQRERAEAAEAAALLLRGHALGLATALEERCGPLVVEETDTVVLFRGRGCGFGVPA